MKCPYFSWENINTSFPLDYFKDRGFKLGCCLVVVVFYVWKKINSNLRFVSLLFLNTKVWLGVRVAIVQ